MKNAKSPPKDPREKKPLSAVDYPYFPLTRATETQSDTASSNVEQAQSDFVKEAGLPSMPDNE